MQGLGRSVPDHLTSRIIDPIACLLCAGVVLLGLMKGTVAVARDCDADVAYLPGSAMRKAADRYSGQAKTDARGAFITADAAVSRPQVRHAG